MDTAAAARKWDRWRAALPQRAGRVTLREVRTSDTRFLESLFLDAEIQRFAPGLPATVAAVEQYVEWAERMPSDGRKVCLAVAIEARLIGVIHAWPLEPTATTVEWGFVLGRAYWGRGLFQEAAAAFISSAIHQLGVVRFEARTAVMNARGAAALTRLGARQEGMLRQAFDINDQRVDCVLWSILAAEWVSERSRQMASMVAIGPGPNSITLADAASPHESAS
jgi:RimJ/RimL family protein N-acetyltransferase